MFGVGGAVVSTPGIRALGTSAELAIGTTLPSILPGAVAGTLRYARQGLVDRRAIAAVAPLGMVASAAGAALVPVLPGEGHLLQLATAGLLVFSAIRLLRGAGTAEPTAPHPSWGRLLAIGAGAGFLAGLLGIGGGVFMVSAFAGVAGMPIKRAVGTSLACVALFAIPGIIVHTVNGTIDWGVALLLAVGVVPGARLGSALALRTADRRLQELVGGLLLALAVPYVVLEVGGLLG